jgi:hypothetical protein
MGEISRMRRRNREVRGNMAAAMKQAPPGAFVAENMGPVRIGPVVGIGICIGAGLLSAARMLGWTP